MTDVEADPAADAAEEEEEVQDVDEHDLVAPDAEPISHYGTDFDVHGLVRRLGDGDVLIPTFDPSQPLESGLEGFQRRFVWNKPQMDRFIESLLLGYPVPGIFLVDEPGRRLLVLDGQQRLRTLLAFYRNSYRDNPFTLENVEGEFKGIAYPTLSAEQRRGLDNTFIHATVIRYEASEGGYRSVYQLFERLNTGGTNLQPQEIRVALFHGRYVDLLRDLNDLHEWRSLYGKRSDRLKDQELILRVLALLRRRDKYKRPLKIFLNDSLKAFLDEPEEQCELDREWFAATCKVVLEAIGPRAFRLRRGQLNAALLDGVMVGVAERLRSGPVTDLPSISVAYEALLSDTDFLTTVTAATANEETVASRLASAVAAFAEAK